MAHSAGHQSKTGKKILSHPVVLSPLEVAGESPATTNKKEVRRTEGTVFREDLRGKRKRGGNRRTRGSQKSNRRDVLKKNEKLEEIHLRYLPPGERWGSKKPCGEHRIFVSHAGGGGGGGGGCRYFFDGTYANC